MSALLRVLDVKGWPAMDGKSLKRSSSTALSICKQDARNISVGRMMSQSMRNNRSRAFGTNRKITFCFSVCKFVCQRWFIVNQKSALTDWDDLL